MAMFGQGAGSLWGGYNGGRCGEPQDNLGGETIRILAIENIEEVR